MKHADKKTRIFYTIAAVFTAAALVMPSFSSAAPKDRQPEIQLDYDLYAGGMHALNARLDVDLGQDTYFIDVEAEVRGFMRHILPWKGSLISEGKTSGKDFVPRKHERISAWPDEVKRTILEYDQQGDLQTSRAVIVEDGETTKYPNDMDKNSAMNAVDLLTAAMHMMKGSSDKEPCNQTIPVYDGKRRYDVIFKRKGTEYLSSSRYNRYEGQAIKCTFELDMKAEKDRKENHFYKTQEKSKARGLPPTVWLGQLENDGLYVPVKVQVNSDYGALLIHLRNATFLPSAHASAE